MNVFLARLNHIHQWVLIVHFIEFICRQSPEIPCKTEIDLKDLMHDLLDCMGL